MLVVHGREQQWAHVPAKRLLRRLVVRQHGDAVQAAAVVVVVQQHASTSAASAAGRAVRRPARPRYGRAMFVVLGQQQHTGVSDERMLRRVVVQLVDQQV
jgi:hypothetical protein